MDIRESVRIDCPEMKERTIDQFKKKMEQFVERGKEGRSRGQKITRCNR